MNEDNAAKKVFFSQDRCCSPQYWSEDVTDVYDAYDGDKKYVYGHLLQINCANEINIVFAES